MSASDDFNRANDTTLGANWTDQVAGANVNNNAARGRVDSTRCASYYSAIAFANDHYSEATLGDTSLMVRVWVGVRMPSSGSINGMFLDLDAFNNNIRLFTIIGGTTTEVAILATSVTFSAGEVYRLSVTGQTYTATKNGVTIGSPYTDGSSNFSSGSAGIGFENSSDVADAWAGGDVAPTPDPSFPGVVISRPRPFAPGIAR